MKKYLLLFAALLLVTVGIAQNTSNRINSKEDFEKISRDKKDNFVHKRLNDIEQYRDSDIVLTTILTEDFSKFTAGSVEEPDETRLDDPNTSEIDDAYFNTPGWVGFEVYQAGGCAFLDVNEETGMLITPLVNTAGNVTIKCRVKSVSADGEYFCYNIINELGDALDLEYIFIPGQEWVDVEFVSTFGEEYSFVILFAMYDALFIDDIEIVNHHIPAPTLLPETNITGNGFTANWNALEGIDEYYFQFYARHTAQYDETYFFVDYAFSNVISYGTTEDPEIPDEISCEYGSWFVFLPVYINNAIGVSGAFSDQDYYGYLSSPEYDLSSSNGTFSIAFSLKGTTDDYVTVNLINSKGEIADIQSISLPDNEWNEFEFQMDKGDKQSVIEIIYQGSDNLFIDDMRVFQELPTGTKVTTPLIQKLCYETSVDVSVQEHYKYDELFYQIYGIKNIYALDNETNEYYVSNAMYGDLSEPRFVTLSGEDIKDIKTQSPASAHFNKGQLNIYNPDDEMVSVYNINGVCVYRAIADGHVELNLTHGTYIIKIGNKVIKVIN